MVKDLIPEQPPATSWWLLWDQITSDLFDVPLQTSKQGTDSNVDDIKCSRRVSYRRKSSTGQRHHATPHTANATAGFKSIFFNSDPVQ